MRFLALGLFLLLTTSCVRYKDLINLREAELVYNQQQDIQNVLIPRIQPEDILDIKVYSSDENAVRPFNPSPEFGTQVNINQGGGAAINQPRRLLTGYRVDESGAISFPVLGRVQLGGLSLTEAKELLRQRLVAYVRDVEVNLRFVNYRVTVIGEVNAPGALNMPTDRSTIFEAIGQAGDMTDYANRRNVLILRELNGKRIFGRLDLQSGDIFNSPFYYLAQNDVVYIEPLRVRTATVADPFGRALGYTTALISLAALVVAFVR